MTAPYLTRVADHAQKDWMRCAQQTLASLPSGHRFTTDDLKQQLSRRAPHVTTHDARAWGAVLVWAKRAGLAIATPHYTPSSDPICHHRPMRVWLRTSVASPFPPSSTLSTPSAAPA